MREDLQLPTELWSLIASYIRPRTLRSLFSVNQAFFHSSMAVRYRVVKLESLKDKKFVRNIIRLSDPVVAERVHSLVINVEFIAQADAQSFQWSSSESESDSQDDDNRLHIRNARGHVFKSTTSLLQAIHQFLPMLTSIKEFTFIMNENLPKRSSLPKAQELAKACLELFKDTLQKLQVKLFHDMVPTVFPLSFSMGNISRISIEICVSGNSDSVHPDGALRVLSMFIKNCNPTLSSIGLLLHYPELRGVDMVDFTPVLDELAAVEGLETLELGLPFFHIHYNPLEQMFLARSGSLKRLSLKGTGESIVVSNNAMLWLWTMYPLGKLLPNLERLDIYKSVMQLDMLGGLRRWIEPFRKLHALSIQNDRDRGLKDYDYERCIRNLPVQENIRCLRLHALFLDKHVLSSLMKSFPNLEWLYLCFGAVELYTFDDDMEKVKSNHALYFKKTLDVMTLSKWQIKHIRISSSAYPGRILKQYRKVFMELFPSLETCWIH